jgi:uncharacterized membrane protein YczE
MFNFLKYKKINGDNRFSLVDFFCDFWLPIVDNFRQYILLYIYLLLSLTKFGIKK